MKKIFLYVPLFLLFIVTFCSCSVLQWRKSDQEIHEKFTALKVESKISYFQVDSLDLKVRIQEVTTADSDVNLVFFHGAPSSIAAWEGYISNNVLIKNANIYAIDRPGYGYSNFGKELPSIERQAQLMATILKEKGIKNIIAVGSSYGGPIAARIGVLNPEVKAVVMISPAIDPSIEKDFWVARFTQWKITRWIVPTAYRVAGDEKKIHAAELDFIKADWKNLKVPVIHIHGDNDDIVPYENVNFSKENFQNVEIITVSGKGHEISYRNTELIIPKLIKLINELKMIK
ncbi:alpha/beta fold hydrolase [Dokdonia sp. 4H-3-7-5]|uniref:alpha/beta fold hydrolase n=1 Tax=Dokdonia sp. (strain 4H-3-7-5) TaxID=983548 RepID=UPI00020A7C0A|nr:alpha/beta hydrolase [Dokdonia sp. 4H-3-7-5]AEE18288.1 alpha/beta hydrolase fold protein [Dokdonia sp. 4H-3-7-5]